MVNFIVIHLWTHASLKVCVSHFSFSEMSLNLMLNYTHLHFLKNIQDLLFVNTHAGQCAPFKTWVLPPTPIFSTREWFHNLFMCTLLVHPCTHRKLCVYFCEYLLCLEKMESSFERLAVFCVGCPVNLVVISFKETMALFIKKCKLQNVSLLDIAWKARVITKAKASKQTKNTIKLIYNIRKDYLHLRSILITDLAPFLLAFFFFFIAVIKHGDQKKLGSQRAYFSLVPHHTLSLRKVRENRRQEPSHRQELMQRP